MAVSGCESPVQSLLFHSVRLWHTSHPILTVPSPFFAGPIDDIDKRITFFQDDLSSSPKSSHVRLHHTLALVLYRRYTLSNDEQDLETSIHHSIHAILLPFPRSRNIISIFPLLTQALLSRADETKLPRDVACCLKHLHYLRNLSFEGHGITQNEVITSIVSALVLQMKSEPGNAMKCLEEMAVLCLEQLSSNLLGKLRSRPNRVVENFAGAVIDHVFFFFFFFFFFWNQFMCVSGYRTPCSTSCM